MEEDVRRRLKREADAFHMSARAPERILRSARLRIAFNAGMLALVVVTVGAGVVYGVPAISRPTPAEDSSRVPDVARVICTEDGTEVGTPRVRAQRDGVHFRIINHSDNRELYLRDADGSDVYNESERIPAPGSAEIRSPVPPSMILVGCLGSSATEDTETGLARLRIVDPGQLWMRPAQLGCADATSEGPRFDVKVAPSLRLVDVVQMIPGVRPTDSLQRLGYPQQPGYSDADRHLIREGKAVALLWFYQQPSGWRVDAVSSCPEAEIGQQKSKAWCPVLLDPRPDARVEASDAARRWAQEQRPAAGASFRVAVARARGKPLGGCGDDVWERTWVANIRWSYARGSPATASASLSSNTLLVGRTFSGWDVWLQFH